ncbi:hypothetical protein NPIL_136171 [Nephila pilipes]|uniref:Uncharacterized protein n=1 Tax=Nephila pilipes TaxID=299642 RepID=A0A8X6R1B1_NEPPI|nr:hypothetical protein NPIL_136171 [Nephila pilipes]
MTVFLNFDDLFQEVDLPVPLSPLPPTPVSSPRPMSPAESVAELPELYFEKSVAESPELSFAESVAKCCLSLAHPIPEQLLHDLGLPLLNPRSFRSFNGERILHDTSYPVPNRRRSLPNGAAPMKGKTPADILLPIADLKRPGTRSQISRPQDPRFQETRRRDFKIQPRHIPTFGRRFLPSSWKEPRPPIFSTTTGWRSLVAATMASLSQTASCPTLWTSGLPRPCRNVLLLSTLSVSPITL